eukprot:scaffold118515_cov28-Tisochrysis_lutea.AAC.5
MAWRDASSSRRCLSEAVIATSLCEAAMSRATLCAVWSCSAILNSAGAVPASASAKRHHPTSRGAIGQSDASVANSAGAAPPPGNQAALPASGKGGSNVGLDVVPLPAPPIATASPSSRGVWHGSSAPDPPCANMTCDD